MKVLRVHAPSGKHILTLTQSKGRTSASYAAYSSLEDVNLQLVGGVVQSVTDQDGNFDLHVTKSHEEQFLDRVGEEFIRRANCFSEIETIDDEDATKTSKRAVKLAPDFRCKKCGRSVGARKRDDGTWEAPDCYRCVILPTQKRDVARRRALSHVVAGVDLDKALAAYRKFAPFKGNLGPIKLHVAHRMELGTRGTAYMGQRKIRVAAGPDATPELVLEVLVHEMIHLAIPASHHHGERFRRAFKRACLELWRIDVPLDAKPYLGVIAYGMGVIAIEMLREKIALGEIELFPPDPRPEPTRAERATRLIEKRAAHAAKMFARADRRFKLARTTRSKWQKKVAYYEKVEAKRGRKT